MEIKDHFERARFIPANPKVPQNKWSLLQAYLATTPNPTIIFDQNETIVEMNHHASNEIGNKALSLEDVCQEEFVLKKIRSFISTSNEKDILFEAALKSVWKQSNTGLLVRRIYHKEIDQPGNAPPKCLFLLTSTRLEIDSPNIRYLQSAYDLTKSEAGIAVLLANGKQMSAIAQARNSSVETVRSHIKAIKKKTRSKDIIAVVRLVCGLSTNRVNTSLLSSWKQQTVRSNHKLRYEHKMTLPDGRIFSFLDQGNKNGTPVLLLHDIHFGAQLPIEAIKAAKRIKLRIISPIRAGYGHSEKYSDLHKQNSLASHSEDLRHLCDHLSLPKTIIAGSGAGAAYAMQFAQSHPDKTNSVLAISSSPTFNEKHLLLVPKRQRFYTSLASYMPDLLPLLLDINHAYIKSGRTKPLLKTLFSDSQADLHALENPGVPALLKQEFLSGYLQGGDAVTRDYHLANKGFEDKILSMNIPIHFVNGCEDTKVNLSIRNTFFESKSNVTFEEIMHAGHLLIYSHWKAIFRAISNHR